MSAPRRARERARAALLTALLPLAACDAREPPTRADASAGADAADDLRPVAPPAWPCPAGWVPSAWGGCGPAVLLCAPDGGAVDGGCAAPDTDASFRQSADGAILGAWPEPGGRGPPAPDWSPDAGIHECPAGWGLRDDQTCDPMTPERCPVGAEPLPGGLCAAEDRCGTAAWPEPGALPAGARVVRVRAGASGAGADGSEGAPFGSLDEAARAAGDNGALLLADGTYPAALRVTGALTVVGRCPGGAVLQGGASATSEVLRVSGGGALTLRGVTLRGGGTGVFVEGPAQASLRGVVLEGASAFAAVAHGAGASLVADDVVVRAGVIAPRIGFVARAGAALSARRVAVRDVSLRGVAVLGVGTRGAVEDAVIEGGDPAATDGPCALAASDGAALSVSRVVVRRFGGMGVITAEAGVRTRVTLRDFIVRDLRAPQDGALSAALLAFNSDVDAERLLFERCHGVRAWAAALHGAALDLRDSVFRSAEAGTDAAPPVGLTASANTAVSHLTARGLRIEDARDIAVEVGPAGAVELEASEIVRSSPAPGFRAVSLVQEGTTARLQRVRAVDLPGAAVVVEAPRATVLIEDSLFRWASFPPPGAAAEHATFLVRGGGALTIARSRLSSPPVFGAAAHGERTALRVEDAVVERVTGNPGIGLLAAEGASLTVSRSRVDEARVGLAVVNGASARVDGSLVRGAPAVANPAGVGVLLQGGARASVARSLVERNDVAGVVLLGAGTAIDAEDLIVRQMRGAMSVSGRALEGALLGVGVVVTQGTTATVRRVAVTDVRGAALMAAISTSPDGGVAGAGAASLDAEDVFVRRVTTASLGSTAAGESGPMAAGLSAGRASVVALRRGVFEDGADGLYVVSQGVGFADVVAARQRGCGLRTGVDVANSEALARATAVLASGRAHCLFEEIGDVSFPLIDL